MLNQFVTNCTVARHTRQAHGQWLPVIEMLLVEQAEEEEEDTCSVEFFDFESKQSLGGFATLFAEVVTIIVCFALFCFVVLCFALFCLFVCLILSV